MSNMRLSQKVTLILLCCVVLGLSLFISFWERYDAAQNRQEIQNNAEVIARSVWDLDTAGSEVFLKLMVKHQKLNNIIILTYSGEVFLELTGMEHSFLSQILQNLGLIAESKLDSDIIYQSKVIGRIEEVFHNDNIYLYVYIFLLLILLAWIAQLSVQNVEARTFLEVRVKERTTDLNQVKERLAVTLRSIGDGVIATDVEGNIVLINSIAEQLTGWQNVEAMAKPLEEIFHIINEKTREVCKNPVTKVLETGRIISLANHTVLIAKDGSECSIADSGAPIRDQDNTIIGVVLVFRDVTADLQREREQAKIEKLKSVGVLAGGIAHDFNNILGAILGNIEMAMQFTRPEDQVYPLLSQAKKATHRASNLTQQLLTFSKGGEPVKELAKIQETIKESANFILSGSKVNCHYQWDENLWAVEIDSGQISQVIQNIIINANQAMPNGGTININANNLSVEKSVQHSLSAQEHIKITMTDNGPGIKQEDIEKIFDPYFTTKQTGSGLGLAVCHSIINKHDGLMTVKSTQNIGTTFTIYLPAKRDKTPETANHKNPILAPTNQARIMIMDDDEMVLEIAGQMLKHLGYDVVFAEDGKKAVALFTESKVMNVSIDLIIMDLTIPGGLGGQDAIVEIHKIDPTAKVIVASGYSNDPVMANYQDYGFKGAISKPFQLQDLEEVIGSILIPSS